MTMQPTNARAAPMRNPRNGSTRLCLNCASWDPIRPAPDCAHLETADLSQASPDRVSMLEAVAEGVARDRARLRIGLDAIKGHAANMAAIGQATIGAPPMFAAPSNVRTLRPRIVAVSPLVKAGRRGTHPSDGRVS